MGGNTRPLYLGFTIMSNFSNELIHIWLEDGQRISEHYSELALKEGLTSAKSIGERDDQRDFRFFDQLFQRVIIQPDCSILDIGCGKGEVIDYLSLRFPDINNYNYLGIDIVPAFITVAQQKFPLKNFQINNFINPFFDPENKFDIVLALGVLVTRVRQYDQFVEYFVRKMLKCARKYVLFNIISYIDSTSPNYSQPNGVAHSTVLNPDILYLLLDSIDCYDWKVEAHNIFPDATDLFVHIQLEP